MATTSIHNEETYTCRRPENAIFPVKKAPAADLFLIDRIAETRWEPENAEAAAYKHLGN